VQWSPNDDMMYYASWAQTFKPAGVALFTGGAGGFDPAGQTFDTEEMQVWEIGGKTQWLDDTVILNAALFFQDYTDKQVSVQRVDPVSGLLVPRTENASAAEVLGFEADVSWLATEWLQLRASYTFLDTEYTDFVEITTGAGNVAQGGNCTPDNSLGEFQCRIDLSGNELEFAPRHAFVGGFTLQSQLVGETDWFIDGNVIYQDKRFSNRFNSVGLDSYTVADFRFGVRSGSWEVLAYVENAFDDDTIKSTLGGANTAALEFVGPPFDGLAHHVRVSAEPDPDPAGSAPVRRSCELPLRRRLAIACLMPGAAGDSFLAARHSCEQLGSGTAGAVNAPASFDLPQIQARTILEALIKLERFDTVAAFSSDQRGRICFYASTSRNEHRRNLPLAGLRIGLA
jgi:hypothetical protein